MAAGGGWSSAIRVAAPSTAPVGVDYTFYDTSGNPLSMDTANALTQSGKEAAFVLNTNQPSELDLLGATSNGPSYGPTTVGSMYVVFYCPDSNTCLNINPQLIYYNLPTHPWALSVPISWDGTQWPQWSAEGIDDSASQGPHSLSFVVYNQDTAATSYAVRVYNSAGNLVGSGTTPSIPPLQNSGNGQGGTYGALLRSIVSNLPSGTFKVVFDGGTLNSFVEVLQFYGPSATSLQAATDGLPPSTTATVRSAGAAASDLRPNSRRQQVIGTPKMQFRTVAH